ncbi:AgmX/PglI C-terminal domain-containing protein [Myxococcota bacterium]|nr:AgmX/PglI C-terminal domain-containing protein [Myxococcota bacterium]
MANIGFQITMPDGKSFETSYESDSVLIGSGPSAVLRLEDPEVSSIHAVVKVGADGAATIIDLGSEAGTNVNGQAITEAVALKPGDVLGLGGVKLVFQSGAGKAEGAKAPKAYALADEDKTVEANLGGKAAASMPPEPPTKVGPPPPPPAARAAKADAPKDETQKIAAKPAEPASAGPGDLGSADRAKPAKPSKAPVAEPTMKIRDRSHDNGHSKTQTHHQGQSVITSEQDLDVSILTAPLPDANKPTADQRVLEISAMWGSEVIDTIMVSEPRPIVVGNRLTKVADLRVDASLPADSFTIATNQGGEATIVFPADAKVGVRKADGKVAREVSAGAADAPFPAKSYQLKVGEKFAYKAGTLTFTAQYVKGDAKMGKSAGMDWYFPRVFAISFLLHAFFVAAAFITPENAGGLTDDLLKNQNRFAQMILKAQEKEKKQKKLDLSGMKGGAKHKGEEGKFGKKDKPKKDALASKAGAPRVDPNKREADRKIALNSGLLGILKGAGSSGAVSNVFGPGGLGTGINNAMGGLRGTEMGDAGGAGGLGTRGTGAGGGGNSLGIGGLGTYGHGRGTGGYGNIDLGGRGKGTTRIVPGKTIIQGSLSREDIARVIRRNLARFKYCYEKELNANPNLQGKVSVYFTIAPTGSVAEASIRETSMNDQNVESCVEKVMRSLVFPKPQGGGIVVVTYPFVFQAA